MNRLRAVPIWYGYLALFLVTASLLAPNLPARLWQNLGFIRLNRALRQQPDWEETTGRWSPARFNAAAQDLGRAFDLSHSSLVAYHLALLAVWQDGQLPPEVDEAARLQAGQMLTIRAEQLAGAGWHDLFIPWYERGQRLQIPLPDYWLTIGHVYADQGQWQTAVRAFEQAVQADPDSQAALYNLAVAHIQQFQYEKALPFLLQALELRPQDGQDAAGLSNLYYHLGLVYQYRAANSDLEAARHAFQTALDLNDFGPTDHRTSTLFQMGASYTIAADWAAAVPYYQAVLARVPDHFEAHMHLARAYRQMGDLDQAAHFGRLAVSLQPESTAAYLLLGEIYQDQGDLAAARSLYETALQRFPSDPALVAALGALPQ